MGCQILGSLVRFLVLVVGGNIVPAAAVILYSPTLPMAELVFLVFLNKMLFLSLVFPGKKDRYLCTLIMLDRVV